MIKEMLALIFQRQKRFCDEVRRALQQKRYGAAEIHHKTLATMRQPELLPKTTAW
jgi:hypothetical protein